MTARPNGPVPKELPGDIRLSENEARELGIEEVPEGSGPSWQEIAVERARKIRHG